VFPFFKWLVAEVGFTNFKADRHDSELSMKEELFPSCADISRTAKPISTMPSFGKLRP
jgi:hypothetical protein